jgi:hypothetical protein
MLVAISVTGGKDQMRIVFSLWLALLPRNSDMHKPRVTPKKKNLCILRLIRDESEGGKLRETSGGSLLQVCVLFA